MTADLDRLDRLALRGALSMPVVQARTLPRRALVPLSRFVEPEPERAVIERGPRFVDTTTCPMCGIDRIGIEFHGVLMTGAKVHTIAVHTPNMRRVQNGQPRCLGAAMRIVFEGGVWRGAPAP